jgi:hypothetical protein
MSRLFLVILLMVSSQSFAGTFKCKSDRSVIYGNFYERNGTFIAAWMKINNKLYTTVELQLGSGVEKITETSWTHYGSKRLAVRIMVPDSGEWKFDSRKAPGQLDLRRTDGWASPVTNPQAGDGISCLYYKN